MPPSLDDLRRILVDRWGIISSWAWDTWADRGADWILEKLGQTVRFRRAAGDIPYLTAFQREVLAADRADDLVVVLNGQPWLKIDRLGRGGQGLVWIACPCTASAGPDDLVALKEPNPARTDREQIEAKEQLRSEIRILRLVGTHDHIARLVAFDLAAAVLATRLVDGETLERKVRRDRRASIAQTVSIGIDVCRALEALHVVGHIHKDVKPANVVHERDGRAVLIDFGLAEDPARAARRVGGTPYYIAPEVFNTDVAPDARADVYSLAATLYRLLVGQPPHFHRCVDFRRFRSSRAGLDQWRFLHIDSFGCDLDDLRRGVPRPLTDLLDRALSTDPGRRPESVSEFRTALEAVRDTLAKVNQIEQQLWEVADVLLEAYRAVHQDNQYPDQEWENADAIRRDLDRTAGRFPVLTALSAGGSEWDGFGPAVAALPQALKIVNRLDAITRQLRYYLDSHADPAQRNQAATDLLNDLIVHTLESVRATSFEAFAAAHDWRTVAQHYGT